MVDERECEYRGECATFQRHRDKWDTHRYCCGSMVKHCIIYQNYKRLERENHENLGDD